MKDMSIDYENLQKLNAPFFEEYTKQFQEVLNSGWYILGKHVQQFEQEFAAYNNANSNTNNNMQMQDRYLLNMAYFRLKNLTVGYSLPKSVVEKAWISSLRVYVGLENFITWDHLGDLPIDPETISGYSMWNETNYNSGRTAMGIPAFKSVSFGLQLNF